MFNGLHNTKEEIRVNSINYLQKLLIMLQQQVVIAIAQLPDVLRTFLTVAHFFTSNLIQNITKLLLAPRDNT